MASVNTPTEASQFDARTASLVVNGETIDHIESFGYDQSKAHELQYTIDQNAVWVRATPEFTGTFVMKANSEAIPAVESAFLEDEIFTINATLSEDAAQDSIEFVGCMMTDFSHSDYMIDDMPTITGEWQGVNRDG